MDLLAGQTPGFARGSPSLASLEMFIHDFYIIAMYNSAVSNCTGSIAVRKLARLVRI